MKRPREEKLAAQVVAWLKAQHWDVYQEVQKVRFGPVADIVGAFGALRWVVECKMTLSLALLEQALMWERQAHFISVAIPQSQGSRGRAAARRFCDQNGIGMVAVGSYVQVYTRPAMRRYAASWELHEAQKTYAPAGNASGRHWTPFAETCDRLKTLLMSEPGLPLSEALAKIDHHYASDATARATISHYLRKRPGVVRGIECRREGRYLKLYLEEK